MISQRANRRAFRPNLDTQPLEERVVLNGAGAQQLQASVQSGMTANQVRQAYRTQLRTINNDLRVTVNSEIANLYANGQQPTTQQLNDFRNRLNGIINADVIRMTASASLLPNASNRLVPNIQKAFLRDNTNGILSRLDGIVQSGNKTRSAQALRTAVNNQLNRAITQTNDVYNTYFNNAGLNRNSVDASGQRIGLQQYLGNQIINQYGNSLGSLASSFQTVGNSALFPSGSTTSTAAAQQAFASQYGNALNTVAFQLGNNLSLFPGMSTNVTPGLQTSLFSNLPTSTSLANSLGSLVGSGTNTDFSTLSGTAFTNAFNTTSSSLSTAFGLPADQTFSLPTTGFTNPIGSTYSNFGNGFNSGFGSGFTGFGTTTDPGFNPSFGTGFNSFVTTTNPNLGFTGFLGPFLN